MRAARNVLARTSLERNQEVSGGKTFFDFEIPLKRLPEVSRPTDIHERKGGDGKPISEQVLERKPAPEKPADRTGGRPVDESPHRVVEPVVSYSDEIDVVGQAHDKTMARGSRRNLQKRNTGVQYPLPQHPDVNLERRCMGMFDRLPGREEKLNLLEQVIPKPYHCRIRPIEPEARYFRLCRDAGDSRVAIRNVSNPL